MTVDEQIDIVQKWIGDYETSTEAMILNVLNAIYLQKSRAFPDIILQNNNTFSTVASEVDQQVGTDVGEILRAWITDGDGGADGKGTIRVWSRDRLIREYPQFYSESGAPKALAFWKFDSEGYLIVNFNAQPDAVYEIAYDYLKKVSAITDTTESMVVSIDFQMRIAYEAARHLVPNDTEAFQQLGVLMGGGDFESLLGDQNKGVLEMWMPDEVTTERRELIYTRYARG